MAAAAPDRADQHGWTQQAAPAAALHAVSPHDGIAALPGGTDEADLSLGTELVKRGMTSASGVMSALVTVGARHSALPRLIRNLRLADDRSLADVMARRHGLGLVAADAASADPRLIQQLGAGTCMQLGCLPMRRIGAATLLAITDPDGFAQHRSRVEARLGPVVPAMIAETDLDAALQRSLAGPLRRQAECSVPIAESCRNWNARKASFWTALGLALLTLGFFVAPVSTALLLLGFLLSMLILTSGLRLLAALAALRHRKEAQLPCAAPRSDALPVISIMVPLLQEPAIAARLIARLGALDYPRDRLDILIVVEENDQVTRDALAVTRLPGWMRVVSVPDAPLRTKPRALNYALNFARGSLIGVYDAEDAPERDQLRRVAAAFAAGGPELACVQGVLDYYNPDSNWMARCFTIEYAAWFRLVLTGFARLGLVVPLGGTTLFFRRSVLERLGGWDAHNVTEDADLGVRLARHGYRTELVHTVTLEEANCRVLPWIRQRSRWLKGYAMTYIVHMRQPRQLWRELGSWRFFGYQVLFLGTLAQFLLAPFFWVLWLLIFGLDLPLARSLPSGTGAVTLAVLLLGEAIAITINLMALNAPRHRPLRPWVLTLGIYFPLATLAAYKAVWEMLTRPFYWDKTVHGVDDHAHRTVEPLH